MAAALVLVAGYAALGGGRYEPPGTADPCEQRASRTPRTTAALVERLTLSALDAAACELDLSREEITLAFFSAEERARFARKHGLDAGELEEAVRAGLLRAVEGAERTGTIDEAAAALLAAAVRWLPLESLVDRLDDE
jgi:leucyl aminopeptidase (aminopeptidase T)